MRENKFKSALLFILLSAFILQGCGDNKTGDRELSFNELPVHAYKVELSMRVTGPKTSDPNIILFLGDLDQQIAEKEFTASFRERGDLMILEIAESSTPTLTFLINKSVQSLNTSGVRGVAYSPLYYSFFSNISLHATAKVLSGEIHILDNSSTDSGMSLIISGR